jgi:hypothetical protein
VAAGGAASGDPPIILGLQMRVVRDDGQVLLRVLPVKD